ncbi:MAG: tRNA (cytidine(34)-2'-O)-methyltransferase [bacterium]|nr:tRNA (cytidine(34)-2'-O)-methyltransferase [bacterium]
MHIALYQPDIPQNTGTILRMAACLDLHVDIIGPAGFNMSDRALKRAGLDYLDRAVFDLHEDFTTFVQSRIERDGKTLILATTIGTTSYLEHCFTRNDILLMGSESSGVPADVHELANARIKIPMQAGTRSLNLALSAAMIMGEALRQTGGFEFEEPTVLA